MVKQYISDAESHQKPGFQEEKSEFDIISDQVSIDTNTIEPAFVIAIDFSEGRLEPLQALFSKIGFHADAAFVIVQRLSSDFKSVTNEVLAHHTDMEIIHADEGMRLQSSKIHLISPHKPLILDGDRFVSLDHETQSHRQPSTDVFMKALARSWKERAVAIILSGSGTDDSRGIQAIAQEIGLAIVQTPETASSDSMTRVGLAKNARNLVLNPTDMAAVLCRHMKGEIIDNGGSEASIEILDPPRQILELLRRRFGSDFGYYKRSTVDRRIRRRADLAKLDALEDYVDLLKSNASELEALYHDILIGVTAFMRDREAFDVLAGRVIPKIGARMANGQVLRIWIPGCATGEEVYSIAMLLADFADQEQLPLNFKIFATDLHDGSLQKAGEGVYDKAQLSQLSKTQISRHFTKENDRYRIVNRLRRSVIFSKHNVLCDPPIMKVDLISCRNLLIYLTDIAQKKVLSIFHFSMNKNGYLFLGSSETVSKLDGELETVDGRHRIYSKIRDAKLPDAMRSLPVSTRAISHDSGFGLNDMRARAHAPHQLQAAYDLLLARYAPSSFLVDHTGNVLHVFGDATTVLRSPQDGQASTRLSHLVRPELRPTVTALFERVMRTDTAIEIPPIHLKGKNDNKAVEKVTITGEPLGHGIRSRAEFALIRIAVSKANHQAKPTTALSDANPDPADNERLSSLERALELMDENLQTAIEELETSNEELQASNEELQASNEELQSTNEELHSVNEELHTVSVEHEAKILELSQLNQDIDNLLRSTEIGTLFVDRALQVRKFTPAAGEMLNLVEEDIGRPINHITYRFDDHGFHDAVTHAVKSGEGSEREVELDQGRTFLMRIRSYRRADDSIDGAVVTFVDVQELKQALHEAQRNKERVEAFLATASDWLWETDSEHRLNFTSEEGVGSHSETLLGRTRWQVAGCNPRHDLRWRRHLQDLEERRPFHDFDFAVVTADGEIRHRRINGAPMYGMHGEFLGYRGTGRDITDQKLAAERLEAAHARYRDMYNRTPVMLHSMDREGRLISVSDFWCEKMGYTREEVIGQFVDHYLTKESSAAGQGELMQQLWTEGAVTNLPQTFVNKSGLPFETLMSAIAEYDQDGVATRTLSVMTDVSELQAVTRALGAKNAELEFANIELERFTYIASHDLKAPLRVCQLTLGYVSEAIANGSSREAHEQLEMVRNRLDEMGLMLSHLLDYARVGRASIEKETGEPGKLIEEQIMLTKPPLGFSIEVQGNLPKLVKAPVLFAQVIRNLLDNAIRHHDRETGTITILVEEREGLGVFEVADDGPGVDEEYRDIIFELFRRVSGHTPGDGIGLALVKKAVERFGGTVLLHNNDGERGATFRFTWPVCN